MSTLLGALIVLFTIGWGIHWLRTQGEPILHPRTPRPKPPEGARAAPLPVAAVTPETVAPVAAAPAPTETRPPVVPPPAETSAKPLPAPAIPAETEPPPPALPERPGRATIEDDQSAPSNGVLHPAPAAPPPPAHHPTTPTSPAEEPPAILAYCARCRTRRPLRNPRLGHTRDGRSAWRGICAECGAGMFAFND